MQTGMKSANDETGARRHFGEAAEHYIESAGTFPQDDEKHACEFGCLSCYANCLRQRLDRFSRYCC